MFETAYWFRASHPIRKQSLLELQLTHHHYIPVLYFPILDNLMAILIITHIPYLSFHQAHSFIIVLFIYMKSYSSKFYQISNFEFYHLNDTILSLPFISLITLTSSFGYFSKIIFLTFHLGYNQFRR